MSLAIGIDCSELRMGWAVVDYDTQEPLALGVEDLRERDGGWAEDQVLRAMRGIRDRIGPDSLDVYVVGIEDAYLGPNKKASLRHASVVGMATMAARVVFGPSVTYWPIPADSWRAALGIKGKNRADKKLATMEWAYRLLEDDGSTDLWRAFCTDTATRVLTDDEADALGIAVACARLTERNDLAA